MANEKKVPYVTLGVFYPEHVRRRYEKDFFRTTQEIAYHIDVRDSETDPDGKAREQRIIDKRVKHLHKLERKLGAREQ